MQDAASKIAFAKRYDLWYDIPTGDLLTMKSARDLISRQRRILDKVNHLLGANDTQIRTFLSSQVGDQDGHRSRTPTQPADKFDLDLIEAWDSDTMAIVIPPEPHSSHIREQLDLNDIITRDSNSSIGRVTLVDRDLKDKLINILRDMGAQIAFISRESVEQTVRSRQISTSMSESPMKGQDRFFQIVKNNVILTLVFDGHGSNAVIEFISSQYMDLAEIIAEPFPTTQSEAMSRTKRAFTKFETRIKSVRGSSSSGSTVVLAAHKLETKQCFFAHIGDSRVVWSLGPNKASGGSEDHKPDTPEETARIEKAGGNVTRAHGDVPRVGGVLATSRSFGDTSLKSPNNLKKEDFVSIIPTIDGPFTFESGSFYALASDGVFDVVQNDEIIRKVRADGVESAKKTTHAIANLARARGSRDDITFVLVWVL